MTAPSGNIGATTALAAVQTGANNKAAAANKVTAAATAAKSKAKEVKPPAGVQVSLSGVQPNFGFYNKSGLPAVSAAKAPAPVASVNPVSKAVSQVFTAATTAAAVKAAATERSAPAAKPEKGVAASTTKEGTFIAGSGEVVVNIKNSDSGYNNRIFYSTDGGKTKNFIGVDNVTGEVNLGKFKPGTKIDFGIVNDLGQAFTTGGAKANADNFNHTQVSKISGGFQIGFEDLFGGGDRDFNDAILTVSSMDKPAVTPTPKDNRSGLGDDTNPGRGAGRDNAQNTGTLNPNQVR